MPRKKPFTVVVMVNVMVSSANAETAMEEAADIVLELTEGTEHVVTPLMFYEGHGDCGFMQVVPDTVN